MPEEKRNAYINEGGIHHLDKEYTVFGEVIEGFEVIDKLPPFRQTETTGLSPMSE